MLSVVDDVSVDSVTSVITLLILKICRLSLLNMLIGVGCVHVFMSVRACVRVCEYLHMYCVLKQKESIQNTTIN